MDKSTCLVDTCISNPCNARGWCRKHYQRWWKTGDPLGLRGNATDPDDPLCVKLTKHSVRVASGCLEWMKGRLTVNGYGITTVNNTRLLTHRASWEVSYGPIPVGMWVLHTCDNPPCIEPTHLFLGTRLDNVQDMVRKGRGAQLRGEQHGMAKLSEAAIIDIRTSQSSNTQLAAHYGVSRDAVYLARRGVTWRHINVE